MHIVSWNCRGLGNPSKDEAVKDLIKMVSLDVLLLQETKVDEKTLLSLSKMKWKKNTWIAVSARGSSGGLATLWAEDTFSLENSFKTQHWIFTEIRHIASKISLSIFNLYVLVNFHEKKEHWKSLVDYVDTNVPSNVIVVGDLNIMLDPMDKNERVCGRDPMLKTVENLSIYGI